jgi:FdhD protein
MAGSPPPINGVSAAILAGGASRRMGRNKALLPFRGAPLIEAVYRRLARLFPEVLVVTNSPDDYPFLPCRKVPDLFPGMGAFAGLHSAVAHARHDRVFVVACDMPYLNAAVVRHLCALNGDAATVVPVNASDLLEPLHAVYHRQSLAVMEELLASGERSILALFPRVPTRVVGREELSPLDPKLSSFTNVNTPADYESMEAGGFDAAGDPESSAR